jgi:hypothetical protein
MAWFVKGWIAKHNGHPTNWANVANIASKEKAQCLGIINKSQI